MVKLEFLGALNDVGSSGVLVDNGGTRVVLDFGTKIKDEPATFPHKPKGRINAVILSHAHLDHSGGLALLNKIQGGNYCPIYAPRVTKPLVEMLLNDSIKISKREGIQLPFTKDDVKRTIKNFSGVTYRKMFSIGKRDPIRVRVYDAGHIPGSSMPVLEVGNDKQKRMKVLYTGDFNTDDTQLLKGSDKKLPKIDVLIMETTYSKRDHPDRKEEEKRLVRRVKETIANGGVAVMSSFAIGRTQEILLILAKHGIDYPIFMDGMAKKATTIINSKSEFLHERKALDNALKKVTYINNQNQRKKAIKNPCAILTTSGMLNGGPVVWYLDRLHNDTRNTLSMTGYQVEGSAGHGLLETGRFILDERNFKMKMDYKRFDFSSHTGRDDLFKFVDELKPQKIFCVHGDNAIEFAEELRGRGFDAVAPVEDNRTFEI